MDSIIPFLEDTYKRSCAQGGHSWAVINAAMGSAIALAIRARFSFDVGDFEELAKLNHNGSRHPYGQFGFWRWVGKDTEHWYGEDLYRLAVESNNLQAARAIEKWHQRKPFIVKGDRFYVRKCFQIANAWWTVGSFSDDGLLINIHSKGVSAKDGGIERKRLTAKELKVFVEASHD